MAKIIIGKNLQQKLRELTKNRTAVIVTDDNMKKLYLERFFPLSSASLVYSIPPGEQSKNRKMKEKIEDFMLEHNVPKNSVIIALGGGVVTDLAGFVASTYKRGISYINVPTTLLGMVDASIGGKTGIDTKHGKNLIGAIWQPEAILMDMDFLATLPEDEISNGMAEAIKTAVIGDRRFFDFLERADVKNKDDLTKIIKKCSELKSKIVKKDLRDRGVRNLLNFGHTIGHAIEKCSNYKLKHGCCVSIGMAVESQLARNMELLNETEFERIITLLKKYNLPTKLPKMDIKCILDSIKNDKKMENNEIKMILIKKIGKPRSVKLSHQLIKKVLE